MIPFRLLSPSLAVLALAGTVRAQQPLPEDRAAGAAAIRTADLKERLGTLAGPGFEGRGTGEEGFRKAAEFVRDHFEGAGLEPRGDDGTFLQRVPWSGAMVDPAGTWLSFRKDGKEVLRVPAGRLAGSVSRNAEASGPVVLAVVATPAAGEGSRRNLPAIAGLDQFEAKDKVVLVHFAGAEDAPEGARMMARFAAQRQLQGRGAAAVLFTGRTEAGGGLRGRTGMGRGGNPAAAGARLAPPSLDFGGADLEALLAAADQEAEVLAAPRPPLELGLTAELKVAVTEQQLPAWNVVGVLRGTDQRLRDEYVVVGSHLDHLGRRGDTVYPGADDDGSGTTGVLAVVDAFAANPVKPRRSVLFVTFCGEESGLLGSRFFVDHCPIPLSAIAAELQMDMIGRDEESQRGEGEKAEDNRNTLHLIGTKRMSMDLHELCLHHNERAGFELEWDEEDVFFRSDHANFAQKGVPIAFFFTGFHRDYHQPSDTPDKIHYEKLGRVATYVYDLAFELARRDERPLIDAELWAQSRGQLRGAPETPAAPVREAKASGGSGR